MSSPSPIPSRNYHAGLQYHGEPGASLAPATLPADTIGVAYDQTITAAGGTGTLALVVSNIQDAIPGLTVPASGTGSLVISGTPTAAGTETFTLTATDSLGATTTTSYSVTVNAAPSLAPATLPADTIGVAYDQTITASGGTGTLALVVSNIQDAIPGLTVPASGTGSLGLSGTPTATGTETFTLTATDSLGATTTTSYSVTVNAAPSLAPATLPADTIGVAYNQTITAAGGTGTLAFGGERHPGRHPRADHSGQRYGKPGHKRHAYGRRDRDVHPHRHRFAGRETSTNYSVTVNPAPALTPATLPDGAVSAVYDQTITASGGTGTLALVVSNIQDAIPGLAVPASSTGSLVISGTPTATGTETFTVTATDSLGATTTANYSITVDPALTLVPATLPADTVGVAYDQTITGGGGTGTLTLAVSNIQGAIPGLTVPTTGTGSLAITGTPTATGTETFALTITDSLGATTTQDYSITVNAVPSLAPATLPADSIGVAYNQTITASGGTGTLALVVSDIQDAIPGLTVPASGTGSLVISGTPTAAGTETFTVTATDSVGATTTTSYSVTVNAPLSLAPATLPADTVGVAYDQTITASGGTGTLALTVSNIQGAIPGLTVPTSGTTSLVFDGTPTAAGTETFTVTATDSLGATTTTNYSITVNAAPSLSPATLPADTIGVAYDQTITASGGTGTLALVVSNIQDAIPGLTVPSSGTGSLVIGGTPTAAGTETFTVTATDSLGATTTTNYSITVNAAPSLSPATLPADTVGVAYDQTITADGGTGTLALAVSNIQAPSPD